MTRGPICLTLPEPPSANVYYRKVRNRMILSDAGEAYKLAVLALGKGVNMYLIDHVTVTLRWYRKRKSGDLDNRLKPVMDALQGVAYADDSQVTRIIAERHDDKHNPRVEVIVAPYAA